MFRLVVLREAVDVDTKEQFVIPYCFDEGG
jgi:hypothetical protein